MSFRVLPLPADIADQARRTGRAPGYGHPVHVGVAKADGYGPCRCCLRRTREGERRILFTYNPYPGPGEVPVAGPVFIHEERCAPYAQAGFPEELRGLPMVLEGHLRDGAGVVRRRLGGAPVEDRIEELLQDPRIAFLSIRNAEAGCFMARVVRGDAEAAADDWAI